MGHVVKNYLEVKPRSPSLVTGDWRLVIGDWEVIPPELFHKPIALLSDWGLGTGDWEETKPYPIM